MSNAEEDCTKKTYGSADKVKNVHYPIQVRCAPGTSKCRQPVLVKCGRCPAPRFAYQRASPDSVQEPEEKEEEKKKSRCKCPPKPPPKPKPTIVELPPPKPPKEPGATIKSIKARGVLDSCGHPTMEIDVITDFGRFRSSVPMGVTMGDIEALEIRDKDGNKYLGMGVVEAAENVNNIIAKAIIKADFPVTDQQEIDNLMINLDCNRNKSKFGVNAILGISTAICKAGAAVKELNVYEYIAQMVGNQKSLLPVPIFTVIRGGKSAKNDLLLQEYQLIPSGADDFNEAMKMGTETYHCLKEVLATKYGVLATRVTEQGAFSPPLKSTEEALEILTDVIEKCGYAKRIVIGLNVAANEFYTQNNYDIEFKQKDECRQKNLLPSETLLNMYLDLMKRFPIASIEDPFSNDDWDSWAKLTKKLPHKINQIAGNDLIKSNCARLSMAIDKKACNTVVIKLNQIGTITEALEIFQTAKENDMGVLISHRACDTEDTFIADFAVGLSNGQIKAGAPCRMEHVAKYNQLLRIEEELESNADYAAKCFRMFQW